MHDIEIPDINAEFHRRRTEERRELSATKHILSSFPQLRGNLARVRTSFHAGHLARSLTIEFGKEPVGLALGFLQLCRPHPLGTHRIGPGRIPVSQLPDHRSCKQLDRCLLGMGFREPQIVAL